MEGRIWTGHHAASASFDYDPEVAFADGSYLRELQADAKSKNLVLVEREGRITAFPLLLKLEPGTPAVRIGRKLERQIRPSVLTAIFKRAQDSAVFNPQPFLDTLFRAATHLARADARSDEPRPGAVVPLADIYDLLTLRPGAAADYTRESFAVDLLRLDGAPDTRPPHRPDPPRPGFRLSLPRHHRDAYRGDTFGQAGHVRRSDRRRARRCVGRLDLPTLLRAVGL